MPIFQVTINFVWKHLVAMDSIHKSDNIYRVTLPQTKLNIHAKPRDYRHLLFSNQKAIYLLRWLRSPLQKVMTTLIVNYYHP